MSRIWFDDGHADVYTKAYPLMKAYKQIGIVAVITGQVGQKMYWAGVPPNEEERWIDLMPIEHLQELVTNGWKIASHSVTHRDLDMLTLEEVEKEILDSKKWIQDKLKVEPLAFAPPRHRITPEQEQLVLKHYPYCRTWPGQGEFVFHTFTYFGETTNELEKTLQHLKMEGIKCI